jgi:hypothetical protein
VLENVIVDDSVPVVSFYSHSNEKRPTNRNRNNKQPLSLSQH